MESYPRLVYKCDSYPQVNLSRVFVMVYSLVFKHHFPMQKVEKIELNKSSDVTAPVISDRVSCVRRRSSAMRSI
mgnify:CR=1